MGWTDPQALFLEPLTRLAVFVNDAIAEQADAWSEMLENRVMGDRHNAVVTDLQSWTYSLSSKEREY